MTNAKKTNGIALGFSTQKLGGVSSVTFDYAEDKYRAKLGLYTTTKRVLIRHRAFAPATSWG